MRCEWGSRLLVRTRSTKQTVRKPLEAQSASDMDCSDDEEDEDQASVASITLSRQQAAGCKKSITSTEFCGVVAS